MTPVFPARRPDGSFCVEVVCVVDTDEQSDLAGRVERWFLDWLGDDRRWPWFGEDMIFSNEFSGPPFAYECESGALRFRLVGTPTAKWWKDILVLILKDLQHAFAEIKGVSAIRDRAD
jgi:hypothetical protein